MTVKELKQKIANLPDEMDVFIRQTEDEYKYSLSATAEVTEVEFDPEEMPEGERAIDNVLLISDEY